MASPYMEFNQFNQKYIHQMGEIEQYTETINDRYKIFRTMTNIVNNCPADSSILNEIIYPQ